MAVYARTKNSVFLYAGIGIFLFGAIRLRAITKNTKGGYSGKVYNNSDATVSCLMSEKDGSIISISPGMSADGDGVKTSMYADKVYKLRNGTAVYIGKNGNVKAYSPISAAINPGWKDRSYFEKEGAIDQWESLFNCN